MSARANWSRVRDVFESLVDLDLVEARAEVHRLEQQEPEVAAEVRSLLEHHSRAGHFMEVPAAALDADDADSAPHLQPGDTIGAYRVEREVGRGGMGQVFLATDTRLNRPVALKLLPPSVADHPAQRERLKREARAAALLSHPGICTVYALEEVDDLVVVVSEFIDGRSLREEIAEPRRLSAADLQRDAFALADALSTAHDRGITHRDLKPENIMRAANGRLKILDFGLALTAGSAPALDLPRLTAAGAVLGTPAYMAPEQLRGEAADARSDVFSLGVVLYELATGVHPFEGATPLATAARVLESAPSALGGLRADVSPVLTAAIDRALSKAPQARFASAAALRTALSVDDPARPASPHGTDVAAWWRRHQLVAMTLYLLGSAAAWQVKEWVSGPPRVLFPFVGILAVVGAVFRGHLLFAERMNQTSFAGERQRARSVTAVTDVTIGAALLVDGVLANDAHEVWSLLIMGLAIGIVLARLLVERSTSRGAFGDLK